MATKYGLSGKAKAMPLFLHKQKRTVKGSTPKAILLPPFFCFFRLIVRKGVDKAKKGATVEYEVTAAQDLTTDNIKFKEK